MSHLSSNSRPLLILLVSLCLLLGDRPADLPGQSDPGWIQSIIDQAQPRMVKVFGAGAGRVEGFATGLIVSNDGQILTTQGVFLDGQQVRVVLADGSSHVASILRRNRTAHLALLKIQKETPDYFEVPDQPVGQQGDWVVAVCNAFKVADKDEPISATLGVISLRTQMEARLNKRDVAYAGELILIDAITSNPGAAGGALLTSDGRLAGMVGKIINSSETNTRLNYAVPSQLLSQFLAGQPLAEQTPGAAPGNADLGILLFKLGGRSNPAYVDRVLRGSPAAAGGLQTDDMIVSIDGQKIGSVQDYEAALDQLTPGTEVLVIVKRGSELVRARMTPRAKEKRP